MSATSGTSPSRSALGLRGSSASWPLVHRCGCCSGRSTRRDESWPTSRCSAAPRRPSAPLGASHDWPASPGAGHLARHPRPRDAARAAHRHRRLASVGLVVAELQRDRCDVHHWRDVHELVTARFVFIRGRSIRFFALAGESYKVLNFFPVSVLYIRGANPRNPRP